MTDALHMAIRGHTVRAVIHAIDDGGAEQQVAASAHVGGRRTQIPVHYPFGFAAHVPPNGAITYVVANGADQSDAFALPPSNPSAARMGELPEGDSMLYDAVGQKVWLSGGKIVKVDAHTEMDVTVGGKLVMQVAASGVTIEGDLSVTGNVKVDMSVVAQDDVKAGDISLTEHKHSGVKAGSDSTGAPE